MIVPLKLILFGSNLRAIGLLGYLQLNDPLARLDEVEKGRGFWAIKHDPKYAN